MKSKTKKIILNFILFLFMAGIYGGVISFINQYLRTNDLATPTYGFILKGLLICGFIGFGDGYAEN